ncbi:MAG: autotransporter, partial [Rhodobacteraceae bacterium]|nr:autotransporter [Paracoccaceae bacterium]
MGAATSTCDIDGSLCEFVQGNAPAIFTFDGSSGSQSTAGGSGPDYTFIQDTNLNFDLPTGTAYQGVYIRQTGGDGSYSGPSAGGNGGNITFEGPDSVDVTIPSDLSIGDAAAGILIWTQGGPGTDNNENNGSNGAPGGSGGAITQTPLAYTDVSVTAPTSKTSNTNDFVGIELRSYGGEGGRLNESDDGTERYGGDGGQGGTITWTTSNVTVGSTSSPLVANNVIGIRARSFGGDGPDDYNSHDDEKDGGGGQSAGGTGGSVTIENVGTITVVGNSNNSGATHGIYAKSAGGDGGWAYNVGDTYQHQLQDGGGGANGGTTTVTVSNVMTVTDTDTGVAHGSSSVAALSSGGAGGMGQSGTIGGNGGNGGTVKVDVTGGSAASDTDAIITATGTNVDAILAYSQGGRGGDGLSDANTSTGGNGGNGGSVTVTVNLQDSDQTISAVSSSNGTDSGRGIVAQSLSNLGGTGSTGNSFDGKSGDGGRGGNGGTVTVNLDRGTIITDGTNNSASGLNFAAGIFAQSIGGGGGDGGEFTGFLGGNGGSGGTGGTGDTITITIESEGTIQTSGVNAYGVLAQSIGGGGGAGGAADGLVVALGGSGGSGGDSDTVAVTNAGDIITTGYNATGILAQSIAGGGGAAGVSGATISIGATGGDDTSVAAGAVQIANTGTVSTTGDAASAIVAQSIGGGGGSAAGDVGPDDSSSTGVLAIGSDGGGAGPGGAVDVTDIGTLTTHGTFAFGLQAQSIGGGGGAGGNAFAVGVLNIPAGAVGGQSGGGGNGGTITASNTQAVSVTTNGSNSAAILLQSIGGGGGSGGNAQTDTVLDTFQFGIGGSAGSAGTGGTVNATLTNATVETQQSLSAGIVAQSIGGGGGSGGSGTSQAASFLNIGVTNGGFGGAGGNGGAVTVDVGGGSTIRTSTGDDSLTANDSIGIIAQSIGGGGGTGGTAASSAITTGVPIDPEDPDYTITLNAQFAMGGRAGDGGHGGTSSVTLSDASSITTNGAGSHGILVQSIGGGGGNGGDASTATTPVPDSTEQYGLTINGSLGAAGGNGGAGGAASATIGSSGASPSGTKSAITTTGAYANGVVVQSIGGGGGNSGVPTTYTNTIRGAATVNLSFGIGSTGIETQGETGAAGGTADLTLYSDAKITTSGAGARGAVVQSIGGGGGTVQGGEIQLSADIKDSGDGEEAATADDGDDDGGDDDKEYKGTVTVQVGMTGGQGGASELVTVDTIEGSEINTSGVDADGILAQSIGGGGGLGGSMGSDPDDTSDNGSADVVLAATTTDEDDEDDPIDITMNVTVGGTGGTGGDSGGVDLTFDSTIITTGDWSDGVVIQAIGGGGGTGGTAMSSGTGETAQLNIGVGGSGGTAGNGGTITAKFDDADNNNITTSGFMAHGMILQSIGGGGGQGGDGSDMAGGSLTVGSGVGGTGGTAGNGGTITVADTGTNWINVTTHGDDSYGLLAQSVGGGGGNGGVGSASAQDDDDSHAIDIIVGGQGGSGGDGNTVSLAFGTAIATSGNRAFAIVAQSIGGGGGIGSSGEASGVTSVKVGGFGGNGGDGGAVTVDLTNASRIKTTGTGGHAIIAQSIGGGGGIGGDISVGPFDTTPAFIEGAVGTGGTVRVISDATITTTGDMAHGIVAQSIGGGGGIGGDSDGVFAGSTSGLVGDAYGASDVSVVTKGAISASGADSIGIFAQSMGGGNTGDVLGTVTVNVLADVTGGSGDGAGIVVASGHDNHVLIKAGATVSAASGTAITYTSNNGTTQDGNTTDVLIEDGGSVIGDILLENADGRIAGTVTNNSRNSLSGASTYAANVVNNGRMVIGDAGAGDSLQITGDLTQTAAGTITAGVDFATPTGSDSLHVAGDAVLDGSLVIQTSSLLANRTVGLISVDGAFTGGLQVVDTRAVDFDTTLTANGVSVRVADTHFGNAFDTLSRTEFSLGRHLDAIFDSGSTEYAGLLGGLNDLAEQSTDGAAYAAALSSLSPGASQAMAAAQTSLSKGRLDSVMRCPTGLGASVTSGPGRCAWLDGGGSYTDQSGDTGYSGHVYGLSGGARFDFDNDWVGGVSGGYEYSSYDDDAGISGVEGDTGFIALGVGRQFGALTLSGAVAGSWGAFDTTRDISVPAFSGTATGDTDLASVSARLRAAYTMTNAMGYLTPILDLDVVHTHMTGYTETGAGIYNLDVSSETQT